MSSLEQRLDEKMKTAMRARDAKTADLVRMVKSKMTEKVKSKGFAGEVDDALWQEVISAYVKTLEKGITEFEKANSDAARAQIADLRWEISQLQEFLPQKADEAQTRAWVDEAVAGLGGKANAKIGAVLGAVMKAHKNDVDPALVRKVAEQVLAG
jgi:uncharacterized protein YqeY